MLVDSMLASAVKWIFSLCTCLGFPVYLLGAIRHRLLPGQARKVGPCEPNEAQQGQVQGAASGLGQSQT